MVGLEYWKRLRRDGIGIVFGGVLFVYLCFCSIFLFYSFVSYMFILFFVFIVFIISVVEDGF